MIFESEAYGCARSTCHDPVFPDGNLDLSNESAYANLLGPNGLGAPSDRPPFVRVLPNEPSSSLLYLKLASKRPGYSGPDVGTGMPTGLTALSPQHLEAVRLWIHGGAPRDRVVAGTAQLLGTCFPPADPLKTPVPAPPPLEVGFQLEQTPYTLEGTETGQGETELCMATYYDLSARAPESARLPCPPEFQVTRGLFERARHLLYERRGVRGAATCVPVRNAMNPENECIAYDRLTVIQDPQSHHSIINNYIGRSDATDPRWGAWTYKFEANHPRRR